MTTKVEPKKLAVLVTLLVVAGLSLYFNVFSSDEPPGPGSRVASPVAAVGPAPTMIPAARPAERRRDEAASAGGEFKPHQGPLNPQDRPDPASIDPTLRLDLLTKVQQVEPEAAMRNIFQYSSAPPPPAPLKPIDLPKNPPKIAMNQPPPGTAPPRSGPPPTPQAPRLTWKYYGYKVSKASGRKQAFLLDGEDIMIAGENESVKAGRYRVLTIGVNSITIEDMQSKQNQTLKLQESPA